MLLDYRFSMLLLSAARDPDVALGSFAEGVRFGPGVRLPRLPASLQGQEEVESPRSRQTHSILRRYTHQTTPGEATTPLHLRLLFEVTRC